MSMADVINMNNKLRAHLKQRAYDRGDMCVTIQREGIQANVTMIKIERKGHEDFVWTPNMDE